MGQGRPWPLSTERIVKYIANSAAKNMSSLDNQMMVPTLTRFGLLAGPRGTACVSVTDAVATKVIITTPRRGSAPDPLFFPGEGPGNPASQGGPAPLRPPETPAVAAVCPSGLHRARARPFPP